MINVTKYNRYYNRLKKNVETFNELKKRHFYIYSQIKNVLKHFYYYLSLFTVIFLQPGRF